MKRSLLFCNVLFAIIALSAQDSLKIAIDSAVEANMRQQVVSDDIFMQATEAYSKSDFLTSATIYEQILKEKGASATVYYNLGNSYYKAGKIAPSILNYERALLLNPGDSDTRHNLEIARLKTVDKIEPVGEFFISSWLWAVRDIFSTDEWTVFAIVCFILLVICLFLFCFTRRIILKKLGFYAGIGFFVLVIAANFFAAGEKNQLTQRNTAIVVSQTVTIKSSPDTSGTDLFILHEGTKVKIKNKLNDWNEIETADGNVGWIFSEEIEVI
ncbi:MAG: tetratricopeptide repeat protein [Dysgonamonadaceae bacterium]|jgi:tetratricopeptide (TPR) repeat protein|nr:tetratricopeptide repeat protein [Dysgonamonadaceae bacterium]